MFFSILAIVGGVVGSGFITGKEIALFFGRNGVWGYLGVTASLISFYFLLKFFLMEGDRIKKFLNDSKVFRFLSITLNTILSASMISGISLTLLAFSRWIAISGIFLVFTLCLIVFKRGGEALDKLNIALVPFMIIAFSVIISPKVKFDCFPSGGSGVSSIWFGLLYTFLNISNMALLISSISQKLSRKQKTQVAFISTLAFGVILAMSVTVLIQNQAVLKLDMPFLSLTQGWQEMIMRGLIMIGSITTLFSLVYSSSHHLRGLNINEMLNLFLSIILPAILSLLGFGVIVTYFYPIASILGCLLLGMIIFPKLFFDPFLKNSNKEIHSSRKDTK